MPTDKGFTVSEYVILAELRNAAENGVTSVEMTNKYKNDDRFVGVAIGQKMTKLHKLKHIGRTHERRMSFETGRNSYIYQDKELGDPNPFKHNQCICPDCGCVHDAQAKR